jgi:hypothetical protein
MKKLIFLTLILLSPPISFSDFGSKMETSVRAVEYGGTNRIVVDIDIKGSFGIEKTSIIFNHRFQNPSNETQVVLINYNFRGRPDLLEVLVDGEKKEFYQVSSSRYSTEYQIRVPVHQKDVEVTSKLEYPSLWGLGRGLWKDKYSFYNPIVLYILEGEFDSQMPLFARSIKAEIQIPENAKNVDCTNCDYDEGQSKVYVERRNGSPYFALNFVINKDAPLKSGLFYILMLLLVFGYVIKGRSRYE